MVSSNARRSRLSDLALSTILVAAWAFPARGQESPAKDWPVLAHDAARSGATAVEIRPPFERKWYRLFPDEGLMAGVQPVVAGGRVYLGTMAGVLHAIDDASGKDAWTYRAGGPILHACAVAGGKVFFGAADGKLYAVRAKDGSPAWSLQTGAAVWNAPVVHEGLVLAGSRDGKLYAVNIDESKLAWSGETGGPILNSPAVDAKAGRVCVGSEDMRVYAFALADGKPLWKSPKLPGVSMRGYHPVIAPDGGVMVTVMPGISLDTIQEVLYGMVKEVLGDFASWRHSKEENARLRQANFKLMEDPTTYRKQLDYLRRRLASEPAYQTFFVLDPQTGKPRFVAPIVYAESMNGPGAPPLVAPDGRVIVKYQALLRSRYEHYSPFLNVGYLDTKTGHVTPVMDQARTYGWHDSLLLVHDEQCQLSLAGRVLINAHQDNVNAMDLQTLQGYGEPFCRGIHEPQPGEAVGIWLRLLRKQELPPGKEWLARGTAVYGGGSVIDVPVSVAGDSFYFLPTHEMNAGAAVIACRMQRDGTAGKQSPPPKADVSPDEWAAIQKLPWDWDAIATPRMGHVLAALPGPVPGTRQAPLTDEARAAVARIADADLERFIWEAPPSRTGVKAPQDLRARLAASVREVISQTWRPLVFPAGKHPMEGYRFFVEPTETLYTLARAYPHLDPPLQQEVKRYVDGLFAPGGPIERGVGQKTYRPDEGEVRSLYDPPPEKLIRVQDDTTRNDTARLHPLWLWARVSGDWGKIERDWKGSLRGLAGREPNKMEEDCRNGHLAGLIAYCRVARHLKDDEAVREGVAAARAMMRERLVYELAHPRGGLITQVPTSRSIFARWRHLTPEVARLLARHAGPIHRDLMAVYVDYHRPTWWLAWNVELMVRNETPLALPTMSAEVFSARAMVLGEPPEKLRGYLDLPWCKADLFYIQKQVMCLEAAGDGVR